MDFTSLIDNFYPATGAFSAMLWASFQRDSLVADPVFVKRVTSAATKDQIRTFLGESCRFSIVGKHPNFACVAGFYFQDKLPHSIYRSLDWLGNLKLQLKEQRILACQRQCQLVLTTDRLVSIALDILNAVSYLHSKLGIIHGDIATRNCYLKTDLGACLSDCALSRDLFPEDYHCLGDNKNRPIKWMSVEGIIEHKLTASADIWSMGVVLWELITRAQQPFEDVDPFEIPVSLLHGVRLAKPLNCPDKL
ncbi:hypothetical protein Ciccas_002223 [Cichlidogyrus casuarinus]|uniref:Protein kinase domain-containing protein n=1 Tax=Cichlidogyrus casuarinus TaxID=1844966 RepID=A0ABD2QHS9_9PLAT